MDPEGEIGDDDSREFDDGFDENLMGDEEDKRRLAQMTEKEREQELFNRSERRETLKIRFDIEKKLKSKAKKRELEKTKSSKQVRAKRLKASEIYSDESSEDSDEYTPENNKATLNELNSTGKGNKINTRSQVLMTSTSDDESASLEDSSSSSSEDEQENDSESSDDERTSQIVRDDFELKLPDLKCIQLKRDKIEEWIYAPFLRETATGLFVKISIGNHPKTYEHMYKVAQITDIVQGSKVYTVNIGGKKTDKQCIVKIGRVERTYAMSFVSNRSFDEDDYSKWRDQINVDGQGMPTREFFNKKKRDLHRANNYEYKEEDIVYEVHERKRFIGHPYNFALKKTELMGEKANAEASNDYEKAREIQQQIDEIEEKAKELEKSRSSSTFSAISFVNERNRYKNIVESERALKESKSVKTEDPFTRRKCNPTIVHNKNNGDLLNKSSGDKNGQAHDGSKGRQLTNDGKNNSSTFNGNKSLSKSDASKSVDDLFQAHANIDLELDLDI